MESAKLIETVNRAQAGDEGALQDLYLDIHKNVYYLALRTLGSPEDAEDITQDVFIAMRDKIAELREPAAFYRWINRVTANKCMNLLHKRNRLTSIDDEESIAEPEEDDPLRLPDKAFDDAETRKLIVQVIDNLPDSQRVCIYFYYYQQLTIAQISEELGVNENTVKSRLALARAKIKSELERKEREEGIKLYAVPLALTPILRKTLEEFVMPEGVTERIWENVTKAASGVSGDGSAGTGQPGVGGTAANPVASVAGVTKVGMTMAAKIMIGVAAAAVITAGAVFLPPMFNSTGNTPPPGVTETPMGTRNLFESGTYEGEYDTSGKRSGYGIWIYDNFRYEGYWDNDMPNGEGTLYETNTLPASREPGITYHTETTVHGNWINGFSDSLITLNWVMENGEMFTWTLDTANGYPTQNGKVYTADGLTDLNYTTDWMIAGVPPWADVKTDSSIAPPSGGNSSGGRDETRGEEGANLTGRAMLTLKDIENWGFHKGMTFDELRDLGLIYDDPYGMTLDDFLEDRDRNPDDYANWARGFSENPEVRVYTDNLLIDGVTVNEGDTALGPHGLAVGMTLEEVVKLFYCDNPALMEYAENPSADNVPEFGTKIYSDPSEGLEGVIYTGLDGKITSLTYGMWRNMFLDIYMENNRVTHFRMYFVYADDN